ncbi:MAG TPA: 2-succinyl-5-enolpyruvyl-6-hydroxy-3-cyclohexene-1-carboxylate synthase, partial [Pseudolysinimonas sp.]|nr:2-succinyl-5-enolpyruvyl-6-hydroxy-3-cyclohexene-1-carboxylate synthase [Pseudolysinimonas sp.]
EVPELIQRPGVQTIVVRGPGREDYNPGHRVTEFVDAVRVTEAPDDPGNERLLRGLRSWVGPWVAASREIIQGDDPLGAALTDDFAERAAFAREQLAELRAPVTRRLLVEAVWNASWPHDRLVLGASRLIRELDRVAPGKRIPVYANRGLAGIDGTIATATGIAIASQDADGTGTGTGAAGAATSGQPGITRVLLGDLALLHDAGSLLMSNGEPRPRLQLIVGNDGGGTIFDTLEGGESARADSPDAALRDRVMLTPQTVDLQSLATAYGWEYRRVATRGELTPALSPTDGRVLIEVPLQR